MVDERTSAEPEEWFIQVLQVLQIFLPRTVVAPVVLMLYCGSRASRSTVRGQGAGITGLGSRPSACSPGTGELSRGGSGPGDVVQVGSSIDVANPREGAADGDWGGWYSGDCSEAVGEC
jgi:hypothetical protein